MIVREQIGGTLVKTYSDLGVMVHGGNPEANYAEVIDPISAGRTYTETNIPIPVPDAPEELEEVVQYILWQKIVELPNIDEPDYFNESEPEPDYFA